MWFALVCFGSVLLALAYCGFALACFGLVWFGAFRLGLFRFILVSFARLVRQCRPILDVSVRSLSLLPPVFSFLSPYPPPLAPLPVPDNIGQATFGFGRSADSVDVAPSVAATAAANTAVLSQYGQEEYESSGRVDMEADAAAAAAAAAAAVADSWGVGKAVGNVRYLL